MHVTSKLVHVDILWILASKDQWQSVHQFVEISRIKSTHTEGIEINIWLRIALDVCIKDCHDEI